MHSQQWTIWGMRVEAVGFDHADAAAEFQELKDEFYPCVRATELQQERRGDDWSLVRVFRDLAPMEAVRSWVPRHRGGSSNRKFFSDGSAFDAAEQRRDVAPLFEAPSYGLYELGGALYLATPAQGTIIAPRLPRYVLADIVENWLLAEAKRRGWLQCHAAGWLEDGRAHIALGDSGVGKTTQLMRALRDGASLLGNDRLFLRVHNEKLQVRGFPLPVNIGCGTIRALGLDVPHLDKDDHDKIRLSPQQIAQRFHVEFDQFWDVSSLSAPAASSLAASLYWNEDSCHPHWNIAQRSEWDPETKRELLALIIERAAFAPLLQTEVAV